MNAIRWGMIGCGAVTEVKSGPAFSIAEGSELAAVASRHVTTAKDYAKRHGVPRVFESVDALISAEYIDAVYVATPPSSHLHYALKVAQAGKPCCVEKPMAMDYAECISMIDAFEDKGVPLFVSYYRRSLPRFTKVKEWLSQDLIGEVREVRWNLTKPPSPQDLAGSKNWRTDPYESPGGYFSDLASHGLNLLQYLLGDITRAHGIAQNKLGLYEAEDMVNACWEFAGGALGVGSWNFGGVTREDVVQIVGTHGGIKFSVFDEKPIQLSIGRDTSEIFIHNPQNIQVHHVENMIAHLRGGPPHPSMGVSAARTNRVMSAILDARHAGVF